MTQITSRFAALGLVLILLGLPIPRDTDDLGSDAMFIDIEDQKLVAEKLHYLWNLEAVYGQQQASEPGAEFAQADAVVAGEATIEFLEENVGNLWDYPDLMAEYGINGEPTAGYAETDVPLDWHRIRFLEENLWDYDDMAESQGGLDRVGLGAPALDLDSFSEEIFWQDEVKDTAQFAQSEPDNFFPESDDVPQLHAGEVNY